MENVKIHWYLAVDNDITADFKTNARQKGHRIYFSDEEGFRYIVDYDTNTIYVERNGLTSTKLRLINHQSSEGSFQSHQLTFTFKILTTEMTISDRCLKAEYQMMDQQAVTSRHRLVLEWI